MRITYVANAIPYKLNFFILHGLRNLTGLWNKKKRTLKPRTQQVNEPNRIFTRSAKSSSCDD